MVMRTDISHLHDAIMPEASIVFYSALEAQNDLEAGLIGGFWSNGNGWGSLDLATVFSASEDVTFPSAIDCQKVTLAEAHQLTSILRHELADPATGSGQI